MPCIAGVVDLRQRRGPLSTPAPSASSRPTLARARHGRTTDRVRPSVHLARSLPDARAIAEDLTKPKVRLSLGASVYDPTDPVGRLLFNVLAMVAESEADLVRSRTREGMRVAKAKGHRRGKPPKPNPRQEAHLVEPLRSGEYSTAELGDLFGVARSTVYRAVARSNAAAAGRRATTATASRDATEVVADDGRSQTSDTYRPRHGALSELPAEYRGRARARTVRPDIPPQTGR